MKVLVVEDEETNRFLLKMKLKSNQFQVEMAVNGKEALGVLETFAPDIILMDMRMPVLDGYATTKRIKSNCATSHIPVIGISAYAASDQEKRARESGCEHYLTKPIDFTKLFEITRMYEIESRF